MKLLLFLLVGLPGLWVYALEKPPERAPTAETITVAKAQLERGRSIFALRCAACHGDTGGGLEEARLAFPADHRRCESCHKPSNPDLQTQMGNRSFETVRGRSVRGNAFAIGDAPPLHGGGALKAFGDAGALQAYIRAAMPRHAPGTLNGEQSYALTAFIAKLNRALPEDADVDQKSAASIKLR